MEGFSDLYPPEQMKGMREAGELLLQKIRERKPIQVIGDYDIDGVMSSYILQTGLKRLGAVCDNADTRRIRDGYGLNESLVPGQAVTALIRCDL